MVIASIDGSLISLNISLEDDWIRDTKIAGSIDLRGKHIDAVEGRKIPGKLLGASIEGGSNKEVRHLSVSGLTHIENNLDVKGDAFIDSGITVLGSVLGSGPYVDVSDKKLKIKVKNISSTGMLHNLHNLQAFHYDLKNKNYTDRIS